MKLLIATLIFASANALATPVANTVAVAADKQNAAQQVVTVSGPAADQIFGSLDENLVDSTDAEGPKGRPVWKTGKNIQCTKWVMGKVKTPTSCFIVLDKKSGAAISNQSVAATPPVITNLKAEDDACYLKFDKSMQECSALAGKERVGYSECLAPAKEELRSCCSAADGCSTSSAYYLTN